MARHSSFKNLIALETRQNFFLIAEISTGISTDELQSAQTNDAPIDSRLVDEPISVSELIEPKQSSSDSEDLAATVHLGD